MQTPTLNSNGRPDMRTQQGSRPTNAWLRLTSSGWQQPGTSVQAREIARRSRLTSWIILGLGVGDLLLLPAGGADAATLIAVSVVAAGLFIAALLNRAGFVTMAGSLLVALICLGVTGAVVSSPDQLELIYLPAYDLLAIAVVVAASVLPRWAPFVVAILNSIIICLDFFLQPHGPTLRAFVAVTGQNAAIAQILPRPIVLQVVLAVVAYLWVRGTDEAIARADRAEDLAALEHAIVEQQRQIEFGAQQLREAHVRVANGDFSARSNVERGNLLWDVSQSLNNLLQRFQRTAQTEFQLRRTEEELRRLASAIDEAQNGRRPIWPALSGTAADLLIERIAGRQRQVPGQTGTLAQANAAMQQNVQATQGMQSMPGIAGGQAYQSLQPPAAPSPYPPGTFASPRIPSTSNPIRGSAFDAPPMPATNSLPPLQPPPAIGPYGQGAYDPYAQPADPYEQPADPNGEQHNRQQGDNPWFLPPENSNW